MGLADDLGRFGDAVALIEGDDSVTYTDLAARVATMAQSLGEPRRLVLVSIDNTIDSVVAYLAALRGGHPVVLGAPDDDVAIDAIVESFDPDVVVRGALVDNRRDGSAHVLHPDLAVLLSTSGSTGTAKLVRLSHDNLTSNAHAIAEYLALTADDRAITTLPLHYCYGLSVLNSHLAIGASVVLSKLSVVDACFWNLARATGVTSFAGVPHTFELLDRVQFTGREIPTLRYVTQAGGRMAPERVMRLAELGAVAGFDLFVMYGQTEATARVAYLPPALAATRPNAIGVAIPGGDLQLDVVDGDVGELVYRGPNVMMGYAAGPEDLALGRTVTALRTGDLARRVDGLFEIVGRSSRFVKPFGVRVDLDSLERMLADAGIAALCAGDDQRLSIGVVGARNRERTLRLVTERLRLPATSVRVTEFDELPRLANAKPDYATLLAAATPEEVEVASVRMAFRVLLGADVGDEDSFASVGGDSLSYVEMSLHLEAILGELPADWHLRSVRDLEARARPKRRRWLAEIDTTVALRAAAIVLIVGSHTRLWRQPGGAHALIAVAGFNFVRFALPTRSMLRSAARVIVPSVAIIGCAAAITEKFGWTHAALVNDVLGHNDVWSFWFVEAIVQISLVLALVFSSPRVSDFERARPMATAYAAIGAGFLIRYDAIVLTENHWVWWPHDVFFLFALGWAAARAPSNFHRGVVSALAVVSVPGFFSNAPRGVIVTAAILAITWLPTVRVPRAVLIPVREIAGASLYIYLTHVPLHPVIGRAFGPFVAAVASLAIGILAWRLSQRVEAWISSSRPSASALPRRRRASLRPARQLDRV